MLFVIIYLYTCYNYASVKIQKIQIGLYNLIFDNWPPAIYPAAAVKESLFINKFVYI